MSPRLVTVPFLMIGRMTQSVGVFGGIAHPVATALPDPRSVILAERRTLVEHPVMSAVGQGLRRIVVLVHRVVGDEQRAGRRGEDIRRPVGRRLHLRVPADHEAVGRQRGAVRAGRPGDVLHAKRQRSRRCQQRPTPPCARYGTSAPFADSRKGRHRACRAHTLGAPGSRSRQCCRTAILHYRNARSSKIDTVTHL